jgi:hypothetical protein
MRRPSTGLGANKVFHMCGSEPSGLRVRAKLQLLSDRPHLLFHRNWEREMVELNQERKARHIFVTPADFKHHIRFASLTGGVHTPTPAELVRSGAAPFDYLNEFGPDSSHWPEIEAFMMEFNGFARR